jgi:hypothetical protein
MGLSDDLAQVLLFLDALALGRVRPSLLFLFLFLRFFTEEGVCIFIGLL